MIRYNPSFTNTYKHLVFHILSISNIKQFESNLQIITITWNLTVINQQKHLNTLCFTFKAYQSFKQFESNLQIIKITWNLTVIKRNKHLAIQIVHQFWDSINWIYKKIQQTLSDSDSLTFCYLFEFLIAYHIVFLHLITIRN